MLSIDDVFDCRQCGDCCFGHGGVRFTEAEAAEAAFYLHLSLDELKRLYLDAGPPPWNIRTDFEGYCLFRQADGRCLIHAAKPEVCRRWPFLDGPLNDESAFNDAREACPGLSKEVSWEDFKSAWRLETEKS